MSTKIKELVKNLFNADGQSDPKNDLAHADFRLTEQNVRAFIEDLPVMFYVIDIRPPYEPVYISPAFQSLGYSRDEWQKNPQFWIQTIHPDDRERVLSESEAAIRSGHDLDYEYRILGPDGSVRWVRDRGCLVRNKERKIAYRQGIILDITSQKNGEEYFNGRSKLYRTIARNIPLTAVVTFDHDLRYTLAEGEQLKRMGLSSEMIEGKTVFEIFPKETAEQCSKYFRMALAGGFISVERNINGTDVQNYILPLKNEKNEIYGGLSIIQDITETKKKNEELREKEERLREIFDNANDLIYVHDLKGNYLSMNKAAERVFGYTQAEILDLDMRKVVAPDNYELASQMLEKKLKNRKTKQTVYEIDCITKDGRRITLEVSSTLVFKKGKPFGVQGIARDITARKETERRIQESESELRALFETMDDLVIVFDREGRYLKIAPTNPSLLYKPAEVLIGKKLHEIFPKRLADYFVESIANALKKRSSERIEYSLEIERKQHWFYGIISPMSENAVVLVARDITGRKISEESLRESEVKYRELFENANDLIYTIDLNGNFTSLNRAGERISGYTREEAISGKVNISHVVAPEYLPLARQKIAEKLSGAEPAPYELEIIAKDGDRVLVELASRIIYKDGRPVGLQGIGRDVSDRKKNDIALKQSESQYRLLSEGIMHQVWTAQPDGRLDHVNGRMLEYFGKNDRDLLNEGWTAVVHPDDLPTCLEKWKHSLETGAVFEVEFRLERNDGEYRWHRSLGTAGRDENGNVIKWFGTNTDIHDQKMAEAKLNHFAKHDPLTNLPNRVKFMEHLERVVKRTKHFESQRFAVLFLDLDRFKVINDSLGHLIGDKLLISFAERLELCIRPGDFVARLGGDEFTVLLNNLDEISDAVQVVDRLIESLLKPFKIDDYEVFTSASVGIVVSDETKRQPEDYLRDADTAMYRAKEAGKARYEIFDSKMHIRNMTLLRIENDLRKAIERNELRVFYQPIVSLETGEIAEFEALIRWEHPEHGLVEPHEFIEVAEETGLIIPIGKWIIEESCRQVARWQKRFPQFRQFLISVNLSAKQLLHPNLLTQIKEVLTKTKLTPKCLRLEVTEGVVMGNSEKALEVLNLLKGLEISLSTDDFGTGFSSLSYLHRFPFDSLKIDRSFISQMDSNVKSAEIVRTILMLAQNLNLEAIAEGIETEEQLAQLQNLGCKFGQGYLFSKPVSSKTVEKILSEKSTEFVNLIPYKLTKDVIESNEIH